ncbi:hypothetical protein ATY81_12635 [Rhizobium sp. R72]|uniref:hypothetical protein n=1 Tax=unclassified Rhizobium TaxID=2613769 RepID=UPI000B53830C|nr:MULTISPECIES: hypothetical protein [unclassified Rhizobium]OWV94288.1 hypothetical protein ATY81_12635 [Rhizobium sp. R72]OWV94558.1 hypothetical protein ATY80_12635 [Rhizobium sp. R711]
MSESLRRRAGFKKHPHQDWVGRKADRSFDIILEKGEKTPGWIADATRKIPEWRQDVKDVYLRWAITINAMHVARDRYRSNPKMALETKTVRAPKGEAEFVVLETWSAADTARNYELSIPPLSAFALTDLYGLLEEIIFELYLIFLNGDPSIILKGDEFKELRQLYRQRSDSRAAAEAWETAWAQRLANWQRKRLYDGLHNVFAAFFRSTGLKRPSFFKKSDIDDWVRTIEAIGEARNLIVHGVGTVSERLQLLTSDIPTNIFVFTEGEPLEIKTAHLAFIECFCEQMFNALNTSLFEKVYGPIEKPNFAE